MPERYSPQQAAALFAEGAWFKAPESGGGNDGEGCVEVNLSRAGDGKIGVRDSKQPSAATFVFDPHEWRSFLAGAKRGDFDLSE